MAGLTEQELVVQARQGDQGAFEALVKRNQGRIYNLALRMTGNPDDALELSQEAFFHAWKGLDRFQGDSAFSTWLYRLTANVCVDFLRREQRRRGLSMTVSLDDDEGARQAQIPDQRFAPETEMERRELEEAIRWGLASLSDEHREVLILRELNGLSYAEIAAALGLEEGTVKSRIARARLALRKFLLHNGNFSAATSSIV